MNGKNVKGETSLPHLVDDFLLLLLLLSPPMRTFRAAAAITGGGVAALGICGSGVAAGISGHLASDDDVILHELITGRPDDSATPARLGSLNAGTALGLSALFTPAGWLWPLLVLPLLLLLLLLLALAPTVTVLDVPTGIRCSFRLRRQVVSWPVDIGRHWTPVCRWLAWLREQ